MERIKSVIFLVLSFFIFIVTDEVIASRQAEYPVLSDCLTRLKKDEIAKMFLDIEDESGKKIWSVQHFVEDAFFKKLDNVNFNFIDDFLKTMGSIKQYPLEALILAYAKDHDNSVQIEARVMRLLYDRSRMGQIIPRSPVNVGNIKTADIILDTYFLTLKEISLQKRRSLPDKAKLENSIKQKVVTLIEPISGNADFTAISFLSNFYVDCGYEGSHIIRGIGRAVYGLNTGLELTIKKYIDDNLKQSIISFSPKENGAQFGTIAELPGKKKFFIKAHQNYPYTGIGQTLTGNQLSGASSDSTSIRADTIRSVRSVDLKELFTYKVLEYTGFGPKTYFILNENLVGGLYIATEEVDDFITFKSFERKNPAMFQKFKTEFTQLSSTAMQDNFVATGQNYESIILELTIFDLIARSMLLSDLNAENIGFVLNPTEGNSVKVVDFTSPIASKILEVNRVYLRFKKKDEVKTESTMKLNNYVYFDIEQSFLEANTFTRYPDILLKGIFKPNLNPEDPNYEDYMMRFNSQKKSFGLLALNRLNELEPIFNKAFTEIQNFAQKNRHVLALNKNISTGKFDDEEKEIMVDPLEDLKQYRDAILAHFQQLSEFIRKE